MPVEQIVDEIAHGVAHLRHDAKKIVTEARNLRKVIFAKPFKFAKKFHPPKPVSDSRSLDINDHAFLKSVVTSHADFVLSNLAETEVDMLIEAMEKFKVAPGDIIIEQGDVGDYLYIIREGSIKYLIDGDEIGNAGPGEVFGELALLYDCPRAATVVADGDCLLYRASREVFRGLQASFVLSNDDDTRRLLKKSKLFGDLPDDMIREMASYMFQRPFQKGEILVKKGDNVDEVYFIQSGRILGKDIHTHIREYADIEFKAGDSFGERAIVMNERAIGTALCETDGVAYVLTKERFLYCMQGMNVHQIMKSSMDIKVLLVSPFFSKSDISRIELQQMAKKMTDCKVEPGETLSTIGQKMEPSLYYVTTESQSPRLEVSQSDGVPVVYQPTEPFGFGKHTVVLWTLERNDPEAAALYREEHQIVNLDTMEQIQTQIHNLMEHNCVISQFHIQNCGSETIYLRKLVLKDILDIIYDPSRLGTDYETFSFDKNISYETLERRRLLGQGSFGQVWLCRDPAKDAPYAMKIQYKRELIQQHQAAGVIRETRVMQKMHHPFVMGLVQAQQDPECLYMVMNVVQGGELQQQMRTEDRPNLSEPAAKFYAACILEGLSYMHRRNFIYRDLKGENVLLDKDGYCVIIDLGFAKYVPDKTFTFCGTPIYIAPEILLSKGHDKSADIWSFGVMIYEMLFGTNPFFDYDDPTINQRTLFKRIVKASFQRPRKQSSLDAYANTSAAAKDLIKRLLVVKPNKRLGCMGNGDLSIRAHDWFKDIDFAKLYRKEIKAPWVPKISDPFDGTNFNTVVARSKSGLKALSEWEQEKFQDFGK